MSSLVKLSLDSLEPLREVNKVLLFLVCAVAFSAYQYVRNVLLHPLRNIPGPKLNALTKWAVKGNGFIGNRTTYIHGLHQKYGSVVRIGPNEVSVSDFDVFQQIYCQGTNFMKSTFYSSQTTDNEHPALFALRDKALHAKRRRLLSHAFARTSILSLQDFVTKEAHTLMQQFNKMSKQGVSTNLLLWYRFFTADVIIQGAFGLEANMVKTGVLHNFLRDIDAEDTFGVMYKIADFFSGFLPKGSELKRLFEAKREGFKASHHLFFYTFSRAKYALTQFAKTCVADYVEHWDKKTERKDIISRMFLGKDPETGQNLDLATVTSDSGNLIVAGTDTTSTTLTYLSWELLTHPKLKAQLQDELDQAIPDINHWPDYPDLEKLPVLRACIKETLRFHAAAPASMPRIVPTSGLVANGYHIPSGTIIASQVYSIHRLEHVFGKDVNEWNPSRWLKGDTSRMDKALVPFSQGPQNCIGLNIAIMELYIASSYFVRCFDGEMAPEYPKDGMDQTDFFLVVPKAHSCLTKLRPRVDLSQLHLSDI